jgi:hypothetical protein
MPINDNMAGDIDKPPLETTGQEVSNHRFHLSLQQIRDT